MASRTKGDERCVHPSQYRKDSPPSTSSHPLDGGDSREPGMLGEWKAVGFDVDGNQAIQP